MTGFYVKYNWCSSREKDVYVDIVAIWEDGNGSSLYDEFIKVDMRPCVYAVALKQFC